jgi:CRP-like cAMP-binding protein
MPIENEALQGLALFTGLSTTELEEVSMQLDVKSADAGTELIREGDADGHPLFVLLAGTVEVVKRKASASVVATSQVRVAQLHRGVFDEMCNANRPAALKIIRNLAQVLSFRLAATDDQLAAQFDLAPPGIKEKVGEVRRVIYSTWQPPA